MEKRQRRRRQIENAPVGNDGHYARNEPFTNERMSKKGKKIVALLFRFVFRSSSLLRRSCGVVRLSVYDLTGANVAVLVFFGDIKP